MSGLYIHIPFCKQACHYCNFHFSTSLKYRKEMLQAMITELDLQKDYLHDTALQSVYLGGGTPSLLRQEELNRLFEKIHALFEVAADAEICLEANPDDLTEAYLEELAEGPINRLSIGIQSFFAEDLAFMNRAHDAEQALRCIPLAQAAGFYNLTVDLIYGVQALSDERWKSNLQRVFDFGVPHISSYCLTVEPGTALDHFVRKKKVQPVNEMQSARQFEILMEEMAAHGYDHYEISNFAKPGHYARHNANYWLGVPYLGIGPSAHSFNGKSRQWNIAHNAKYLKALQNGQPAFEREELSPAERYNEYVMTSIRTIWGCRLDKLEALGGDFARYFQQQAAPFMKDAKIQEADGVFSLTRAGKLLADKIAMELFWVA